MAWNSVLIISRLRDRLGLHAAWSIFTIVWTLVVLRFSTAGSCILRASLYDTRQSHDTLTHHYTTIASRQFARVGRRCDNPWRCNHRRNDYLHAKSNASVLGSYLEHPFALFGFIAHRWPYPFPSEILTQWYAAMLLPILEPMFSFFHSFLILVKNSSMRHTSPRVRLRIVLPLAVCSPRGCCVFVVCALLSVHTMCQSHRVPCLSLRHCFGRTAYIKHV